MDNEKMTAVSDLEQWEKTVENAEMEVSEKTKKEKKLSPVGAIVFAFIALVVFFGIQVVISGGAAIIASVSLMAQYANDMEMYIEKYTEYVMTSEFLTPVTILSQFVIVAVMGLWYYLGFVKKTSKEEKNEINKKVFKTKTFLTVALLGMGCYGVDLVVANIVALISPESLETFSETMSMTFDFSSPLTFIAVVIMAPIGEELTFRGIALGNLRKAIPMWGAVLISALLFALAHANLYQFLYVLPIAVVLGYVGYRYKSVIPGMVLHLVNNLLSLAVGSILPEEGAVVIIAIAFMIILGLGGAYALQKDNLETKKA